ncbi:uncharacterized protein LOC107883300 [Acyrthosiphon pisum]|uniref:Uncharacterized protein n=1 Tax=Acyrthosiphon pisum TaxID=7029 RepID=A0A8R2H3U7_ACYPI|nr:uncharacterized protein LOC107883300 [Acyrthosiphon pisum]|eukprot:XP_016658504.1 PREDICTED: uncharacterized protein LOC107883300 [Acyrthosiphon pisum]
MKSICERDRFAKTLEPDAHVSMRGQKGRRRHVCQSPDARSSMAGNSQTLYTVLQKCSICVRVFGHVPEGIYCAVTGPDGASWNFRRETTFRAQGTVYAIMTITQTTGKLYIVIRPTNGSISRLRMRRKKTIRIIHSNLIPTYCHW